MTYREMTPESAEAGDDSDSGWAWEYTLCDVDDFIGHVNEMSEKDSADWFSTEWWTTNYFDGTERQESLHLSSDATPRMREIWEAARLGVIELVDYDDPDELRRSEDDRDAGLPVPFIHLAEFNKVQRSLHLI